MFPRKWAQYGSRMKRPTLSTVTNVNVIIRYRGDLITNVPFMPRKLRIFYEKKKTAVLEMYSRRKLNQKAFHYLTNKMDSPHARY
jgi:hypothetical protein